MTFIYMGGGGGGGGGVINFTSVRFEIENKKRDNGIKMRFSKCSKISNTSLFLFLNKMVFKVRIHQMLVRIANSAETLIRL